MMETTVDTDARRGPWNKGRLIGQRPPLKQKEVWAIRIRLQLAHPIRDLALFNLAIDSKLRGCDLVELRVCDVMQGSRVSPRVMVMQQKTHRPVQFELTDQTRDAVSNWIAQERLRADEYLFPSRITKSPHLSTRQYARIVNCWVAVHRIGSRDLWNPFDASHQGNADLSAD